VVLNALVSLVTALFAAPAPQVEAHGALRAMMHEGKTGAQVTLDELLPNPNLYAVGALADLAGEITIVAGTAYLSYPSGDNGVRMETRRTANAGAALLVSATVDRWRSVRIEEPIPFEALDAAIAELAVAAGLDAGARFPFLLEGEFEELEWHVIDGRRLEGVDSSHEAHKAAAVSTRQSKVEATLVGFYSPRDQGVFTHMGSTTHVHCVTEDPPASGHVDHVVIPAGATIRLPGPGGQPAPSSD
jgi:acetolactate decarboxylase